MPPTPAAIPMTAEQAQVLTEFARACRTAARSVSLYPATHPAIQTSLARVRSAAARLVHTREVTIAVLRDTLAIDGKAPARPDAAVLELAGLMHDRLIGTLQVQRDADGLDWHALLLLLSQSPEDLIAGGGIAKAWSETGRRHFDIREIDYAEILREREGASKWDQTLRLCLRGDVNNIDETALMSLLDELGDAARFGELLERLQTIAALGEPTVSARVGALLELLTRMLEASVARSGESGREDVLQNVAASTSWLTPDMLIGLIEKARAAEDQRSTLASEVVERIEEPTVASFVARSVARENGASERLALALQLLVPDLEGKERLLSLAREEAAASPLGQQPGFAELWEQAADMLASYSDETFVSGDYARELSSASTQALEVERVSDDPPQRVDTWLATVNDAALRELDLSLLLDLLRIDTDVTRWQEVTSLVVTDIEQRTRRGDVADAQRLVFALVAEAGNERRPALKSVTVTAIDTLADGALAKDVASALRTADDGDVEAYGRLCRTVGSRMIGPLAEALLAEDNSRTIRRLRDVLLGFGTAGRETVERLKASPKANVRRTAIEMLRMFGGQDALADLSAMLDDADPQVQRDAIRAIAQIGSDEAFAILQKALVVGTASGSRITQQLVSLREAKAVPLLCYVLDHSKPRGPFVDVHTQIIDALGALGPHAESVKTLKAALYRGEWWAPGRTATLRRAAALALKRIGSAEALEVLEAAAHDGSRRVRVAAQASEDAKPRGKGRRT
ncbi:MAG: HEAT repeat domain-containing protein [Acidobacteria bacterium]|nr:HEAT repeat domain-containing protein [Acidobacteriota bacterium]